MTQLEETPTTHILQELGFAIVPSGDQLHGAGQVVPEMCVPGTSLLRTSILATWTDTMTGLLAVDVFSPRVPVTLELDVHLHRPPAGTTEVRAVSHRVKAGRSVMVAAVDFTDAEGRPLAIGTGTFMASPNADAVMPPGRVHLASVARTGGPLDLPLAERARCQRRAPGVAVLQRSEDGLNAAGTVNGGLLALAAEEAALSAAPGKTLASMAVRFLRPVRIGPAVATASLHGELGRVEVLDEADGSLAVVVTTRTFA